MLSLTLYGDFKRFILAAEKCAVVMFSSLIPPLFVAFPGFHLLTLQKYAGPSFSVHRDGFPSFSPRQNDDEAFGPTRKNILAADLRLAG